MKRERRDRKRRKERGDKKRTQGRGKRICRRKREKGR